MPEMLGITWLLTHVQIGKGDPSSSNKHIEVVECYTT